MKSIFLLLSFCVLSMLAGCAGMGGNDAYAAAHRAAADSRTAEAQATAKAKETEALAATSVAKACESDLCRVAIMGYASLRQATAKVVETAAPVIAPPVNEALEVFKTVARTATDLYSIRVNGALGLVNATRGAADINATKAGIGALDIYTTTTTTAK